MDIEVDSDLEDISEVEFDSVVVPYTYEPLRRDRENRQTDSSSSSGEDDDSEEDFADIPLVEEWCLCTRCIQMETVIESKCCKTMNIVDAKAEDLQCITDHEGFAVNCTNVHVLETCFYDYVLQNGRPGEQEHIHELYRYIGYRRFTRWVYGLLGKRNRRVVPSCVVNKIREAFPSEQYAGFKYPTGVQ